MSAARSLTVVGALATLLLFTLGCEVESKHPLSDKDTTTPDLRLLGDWNQINQDSNETENVWRVVKHPKSDWVLMAFMTDQPYDEPYDTLFTTEIQGKKYGSWGGRDPETGETHYLVCRYEMPDEDTLHVHFLTKDAIRKAILDNELSGQIQIVTELKKALHKEEVSVTAETPELRTFIEKHADACYAADAKPSMVLKRKE